MASKGDKYTVEYLRHVIEKSNPKTDIGMRVSQESWAGFLTWALDRLEEYAPELRQERLDQMEEETATRLKGQSQTESP